MLGALALAGPSASAATTSSTCGYGTGGQHASTICWLDLSGYSDAIARTPAGQDMTITLPGGGYTMTFNIKTTVMPGLADAVVGPRATPIETRFAFGEDAYTHIPGMPALYSGPHNPGQVGLDISVSDIVVRDASGAALTSYSFVAADAEDNVAGEGGSFTWTSDKAINQIASIDDGATGGCQPSGITGLGTTSVTCAGSGGATVATPSGSSSRAIVVAAAAPSNFDIKWQTFAQSGIALGIQTGSI
ncbi:MAG: CshA/CshB family fibrillar adhesin-related protein, partial [Marmoricola sp.]